MSIIVTGSLAFDHIMDFPGYFKDHIIPEKVHMLNVSFLVKSLKRQRGGCAANIAYNLSLVNERPTIMGTVGHDFGEYKAWLETKGIDTSAIRAILDEFTASGFITTDLSDNQITGFYPGAMSYAHTLSFCDLDGCVDIAIISPNDPQGMSKYVRECKALKIPYIYDPGQQLATLGKDELLEGINGAKVLVANDYEIEMILNKTGLTMADLLGMAEMVVTTLGADGSVIRAGAQEIENIPVAPARQVVDPTGAGDAYRAGLIKGLVREYPLEVTGRMAGLAGTYAVEEFGTLNHRYTWQEFQDRYYDSYGERLEASVSIGTL